MPAEILQSFLSWVEKDIIQPLNFTDCLNNSNDARLIFKLLCSLLKKLFIEFEDPSSLFAEPAMAPEHTKYIEEEVAHEVIVLSSAMKFSFNIFDNLKLVDLLNDLFELSV